MPRSVLSDEDVVEIRALAAQENAPSLQEIADEFGTSKQHVHRIVRGEQRTDLTPASVLAGASVAQAVTTLLEDFDLSPLEDVMAATAVAIAEKLDAVRAATSAQAAMAAPGLARGLQDLLASLTGITDGMGPRLGALRGEEAILVAKALGYPNPEEVDIEHFNHLEVIRLGRAKRIAAQRAAYEMSSHGSVA
jgi:AraC-like DNA-binding protein